MGLRNYKLHMRVKVTVYWGVTLCSLMPQISQTIVTLRYSVDHFLLDFEAMARLSVSVASCAA
jgi:hypothetical protein